MKEQEQEQEQKSWIEEAWEYSRMAIENDLPTTIDAFYEYQRNNKKEISKREDTGSCQ
jgi:hypothetical protein